MWATGRGAGEEKIGECRATCRCQCVTCPFGARSAGGAKRAGKRERAGGRTGNFGGGGVNLANDQPRRSMLYVPIDLISHYGFSSTASDTKDCRVLAPFRYLHYSVHHGKNACAPVLRAEPCPALQDILHERESSRACKTFVREPKVF